MQATRDEILLHIRRGITLIAVLATFTMLERARAFFVPVAFAAMLTLCLNPLVGRLRRLGVPRALGAGVVLIAFVAIVTFGVLSLQDDTERLLKEMPRSALHLRQMFSDATRDRTGWWQRLNLIARNVGAAPAAVATPATVIPASVIPNDIGSALLQGSIGIASLASEIAMVLFLVYFLLIARLPSSLTARAQTIEILRLIAAQMQRFVVVMTVTNVLLGLLTWAVFQILGVSHAAVWGLAAAILHIIPYAGPAVLAVAAALAAAVQFESFSHGLLVGAAFLLLAGIVGMALTSWLSGRASGMNKAAMFVGLLFWAWLWGVPGLLLGVPMMMVIKVFADRFTGMGWLSRLLHEEDQASWQIRKGAAATAPTHPR
jgi:predicted PurR-regulated permease PerM